MRQTTVKTTKRWRTRTASQQKRRKKWTQPSPHSRPSVTRVRSLSSYSSANYLVGDSTADDLQVVRERLGHDLTPPPSELSAVEGLIYEMEGDSLPVELPAEVPHQPTRIAPPPPLVDRAVRHDDSESRQPSAQSYIEPLSKFARRPSTRYSPGPGSVSHEEACLIPTTGRSNSTIRHGGALALSAENDEEILTPSSPLSQGTMGFSHFLDSWQP